MLKMYKYHYICRPTGFELWQLYMYNIYGSMIGFCNIVFTAAVFILTFVKWEESGCIFRLILLAGCCAFTVIQPTVLFRRAFRQAAGADYDIEIGLGDQGLLILVNGKQESIPWTRVKKVLVKPTMIIIFTDSMHGYILTNRVVGAEKKSLAAYIRAVMHIKI